MPQPHFEIGGLLDRAEARADMVGSPLWTSAQKRELAESSFQKFYLTAVSKYEEYFTEAITDVPVAAGSSSVTMEAKTLKFRGIRIQGREFLRRLDLHEVPHTISTNPGRPKAYQTRVSPTLSSPRIDIYPTTDAAYVFDVFIVPIYSLTDIEQTTGTTPSLRFMAGWDTYVVLDMAIAMKDREESDVSVLMAERADWMALMDKTMTNFDIGEPAAVVQRVSRWRDPMADPFEDVY